MEEPGGARFEGLAFVPPHLRHVHEEWGESVARVCLLDDGLLLRVVGGLAEVVELLDPLVRLAQARERRSRALAG